ncbi:MAG: zinc ribbon domain-containing protein [Anaerolineales bacterium]
MNEILCAQCGQNNPPDAIFCQRCGALLPPQRPATEPLAPTLRPGEEPVKKSTAELEPLLPAWLRETRQGETPPPVEQQPTPAPTPPPDPLAELSSSGPSESEEEIPDWLKELGIVSEKPQAEPQAGPQGIEFQWKEGEEEKSETLLPEGDWLRSLSTISPEASAAGGTQTPPSTIPLSEAPQAPTQPPAPSAGEEAVPDWLKAFAEAPAAAPEVPPAAPSAGEEAVPDWLKAFAEEPKSPVEEEASPAVPPIIGAPIDEEGDLSALLEMEIPEWLSGISPEVPPAETPAEEMPALASAELPAWVQAMRPIEAILTGEGKGATEEAEEEKEGPLAGLRGVLPASPTPLPYTRPRAYSIRLNVSDAQQTHVQLLEQLIADEERPRLRRTPKTHVTSQRALRWLITLLIFISLSVPLFVRSQWTSTPALMPQETWQFIQSVNSLPPSSNLLLVLDYEIATSGEIEALLLPFLEHLNSTNQAQLVVVALNPMDTGMSQRFLEVLHKAHPQMPLPVVLDLGYLPGGVSAIPLFAAHPTFASSEEIRLKWGSPPFEALHTLSDFDGVILVTDNAENARAWIEQTTPWNVDLLVVSAARSAPILLPYFYTGQVKGMIGNLNAAAAYEQSNGLPGLARVYRDAYSAGLWLALILGIVGSVWGMVARRFSSQLREEKA